MTTAATATRAATRLVATARRTVRSPWLRPLNDVDAIDDLLAQLHPLWSVRRIRARVTAFVDETPDMRTVVFEPNALWPGFRAGQHVVVELDIRGVRHQRAYSLSSHPRHARRIAITVKRQPGGRVSSFVHGGLAVGDVVTLSGPAGEFVLSEPPPARLLLLSAGSGITPVMSIVRELATTRRVGDVVFLHCSRTARDAAFRTELQALAEGWPALRLVHVFTAEHGRLDATRLAQLVPDRATRLAMLCGPDGFMTMARELWRRDGLEGLLRHEDFTGGLRRPAAIPGQPVTVRCDVSGTTFATAGDRPLLLEAERAGLAPRYGCRMGICQTCRCRKLAGTALNLVTGAVSAEPDETIQLCISAARSDLTLAL